MLVYVETYSCFPLATEIRRGSEAESRESYNLVEIKTTATDSK